MQAWFNFAFGEGGLGFASPLRLENKNGAATLATVVVCKNWRRDQARAGVAWRTAGVCEPDGVEL